MKTANLNIRINAQKRRIVSIDDFTFTGDKITFLFGESGIGKSMISKAIYGLLDPDELHITINGNDYTDYLNKPSVKQIKKNGFFVFQEPSSHLNPLLTLKNQINEGSISKDLDDEAILRHLWNTTDDQAIKSILDIYPKPYRPSGGEKQRILLAMAFKKINHLLNQNEDSTLNLFVFDEPTGSLDNQFRNLFLELLFKKFTKKKFTAFFITHDYSIISEIYKNHNQILDHIDFRELSRVENDQVELNDFSPDQYLSWMEKLERSGSSDQGKTLVEVKPILYLKSRFEVFDRKFKIYKDSERQIEQDLQIHSGEIIYLKAGSGVGKTTLAKIIMGLIKSQKLELNLCGFEISEETDQIFWKKRIWGKKLGMVFQHADESLNLQATIKESLEGLKNKNLKGEILKTKLEELYEEPIDESFLSKKVVLLSGGQKQRLNLLRTLVLDVDLVILDEPLNGLDFISIQKVLKWLQEKRKQGKALLMISHNEEIFEHMIDDRHTYYLASL